MPSLSRNNLECSGLLSIFIPKDSNKFVEPLKLLTFLLPCLAILILHDDATIAEVMEEYDDDGIIHTDEDGNMYVQVFNPERDLPTVANQDYNGSHD